MSMYMYRVTRLLVELLLDSIIDIPVNWFWVSSF